MIVGFDWVGDDLQWNALHYLYVVAGGVLWRQQAEAWATGPGNAIHFSAVFPAVGIHFQCDGLPDLHMAELSLFEIGGDPDIVERDDLHQLLSRSDILADFDRTVADHTSNRGHDFGVAQIQLSLIEIGFFAL